MKTIYLDYEIHKLGRARVIRRGQRIFAMMRTLRDAKAAVRALARGDMRRAVTSFQGQRELEFRR